WKGKSSSLRSRPHPALRATFSRCAGEGLIPNLAARVGKEALLPFTGEGARRADEGARAQRSVPLMLPGRATAARFARALIRRCAPPSPASQEKGCFRTERQEPDGEGLLRRETASGWLRTRPNEKRRPGAAFLRGATLSRRLNPRRCPAPTSPPRTG